MSLEPSLLWLFAFLLFVLFATLVLYIVYSGLVTSIVVEAKEPDFGGVVVAYKTGTGPYKGAGELFTSAFSLLPDKKCLGIYYDDPEDTPADDLRYAVGCILGTSKEGAKPEDMQLMVQNGFKIIHLPKPNFAVVATFPFRTTISIYLAIFRVYPKLKEYISSHGLCAYPAIEVYTEDKIVFIMPLSRQDEFFVPEFSEEQVSIATTDMSSTHYQSHLGDHDEETRRSPKRLDEGVFVKPKTPPRPGIRPSPKPRNLAKGDAYTDDSTTEEEDDSASSSFEDLSRDNIEVGEEEVEGDK